MRKIVSVSMQEDILLRVDEAAHEDHQNRSQFIAAALRYYLAEHWA